MLSESVQNYLKAIYALREDGQRATTNALAERLGVFVSPEVAAAVCSKSSMR